MFLGSQGFKDLDKTHTWMKYADTCGSTWQGLVTEMTALSQ